MMYDAENRLTSFQTAAGGIAAYGYDRQGRRVTKTAAGATTYYVYGAGGELLAEYGGVGGVSGTMYQTEDHLGSTRAVTDGLGRIVSRSDYLPFGETIAGTATFNRGQVLGYGDVVGTSLTFTEHVGNAESGLDYFGARYFSGAQGRWTTPDRINLTSKRVLNPSNTLNKCKRQANSRRGQTRDAAHRAGMSAAISESLRELIPGSTSLR